MRFSFMCLIACLMFSNVGCITHELWRDANETELTVYKLAAVTTADTGQKQLLFSYRRENGSVVFLTVPLKADQRPIDPFQFNALPRRFDSELAATVTPAQINQILAAAAKVRRRELTAIESASVRDVMPEMYDSYGFGCGPLLAIAYRPSPDGRIERLNFAGTPTDGSRQVPADSFIVLVPEKAPRPADEVEGARLQAILLTPFTVVIDAVVDAVVSPIFFVIFLTRGPMI